MKILLTGAGGYIGSHLLPLLVKKGYEVVALVRNPKKIPLSSDFKQRVQLYQGDLLKPETLEELPQDIEGAFYLVHGMRDNPTSFAKLDRLSATNFVKALQKTRCKQIVYLSGLAKAPYLSKHLASREEVEKLLKEGPIPLTILRASIIIGAGSASFEIIRDLVEKIPLMITPKWVRNRCQPIAIDDVLDYLIKVIGDERCLGKTFEIGGPESIPYQDVLLRYAKRKGLKRILIPVPILSPRLSSYWLIFITKINFSLASSLIDSLKNDSVKTDFSIDQLFPKKCLSYEEAIDIAFKK